MSTEEGVPSPDEANEDRDFHRRWQTIEPPLRPHPNVAAAIGALLPSGDDPVLLLGVTPELAAIPRRVIAVDWNPHMIGTAWPGDSERQKALLGDWRDLPIRPASVAAAIGDGSLTMLRHPHDQAVAIDQLRVAIRAGGRAIIRCFARPEEPETPEQVAQAALAGGLTFHAFKMRFNMAVAAETKEATVRCEQLFARFEAVFPDRRLLAEASGWSLRAIAEINAYRDSPSILSFASRSELLAMLPDWAREKARFVETEGYPLAERCPLLVIETR